MENTNISINIRQQSDNQSNSQQPTKITQQMMPHQLVMLNKMLNQENLKRRYTSGINMSILCDKVGSGKSLIILSVIAAKKEIEIDQYNANILVSDQSIEEVKGFKYLKNFEIKSNLLVVPHQIYNQWVGYIKTMTQLNCLYLPNQIFIDKLREIQTPIQEYLEQFDLIIIKSTKYNELIDLLQEFHKQQSIDTLYEFELNNCQKYKYQLQELYRFSNHLHVINYTNNIHQLINKIQKTNYLINQIDPQLMKMIRNHQKYFNDLVEISDSLEQSESQVQIIRELEVLLQVQYKGRLQKCIKGFQADFKKNNIQLLLDSISGIFEHNEQIMTEYNIYSGPLFQRVIIDEIDSISIPKSKEIYGKFNWFITSSNKNLLCSRKLKAPKFISQIFKQNKDCMILFSQILFLKNCDSLIQESFNIQPYITQTFICKMYKQLDILSQYAKPKLIEYLNAGDIKSAVQMLGCQEANNQNVVDLCLQKLKKELKEKEQKIIVKKQQLKIFQNNSNKHQKQIQQKNEQIQKTQNKIENLTKQLEGITQRVQEAKNNQCLICFNYLTNLCVITCCKNSICPNCVGKLIQYQNQQQNKVKCPICRTLVNFKSLIFMNQNQDNEEEKKEESKQEDDKQFKIDKLLQLIQKQGKFLVFSEYDNTFTEIEQRLEQENVNFKKLNGTGQQIQNIINQFQYGNIKVLLLNAQYFGAGLNLQMATDIILYHKMPQQLEMQIIGRAQRPNRQQQLTVTYLKYKNEQ